MMSYKNAVLYWMLTSAVFLNTCVFRTLNDFLSLIITTCYVEIETDIYQDSPHYPALWEPANNTQSEKDS